MKIIKGLLYVLAILWCLLWVTFTYSSIQDEVVPMIIAKHKSVKQSEFIPAVNYLRAYQLKQNQLPSQDEFSQWGRNYFNTHFTLEYSTLHHFEGIPEVTNIPKDLKTDKEYIIYQWNGDSSDYYTSWNNHYSLDDFENETGSLYYFYSLLTGIVPLILLLGFNWIKKLRTTPNSAVNRPA
jgi:hypothetical protein